MRFTIPCLALASVASAATTLMKCSHNNCLRAVIGERDPTRNGTADCSSYFLATLTPDTITFTSTIHQTTTTTTDTTTTITVGPPTPLVGKRSVVVFPTAIPTYATACDNAAEYSSACSCVGVTAMTTTVAAPSTTIYTSPTDITSTSTVVHTLTAVTARLQIQNSISNYNGAYLASKTYSSSAFVVPTAVPSAAVSIVLNPDGSVSSSDGRVLVGKQSGVTPQSKYLLWVTPVEALNPIHFPVSCSIGSDATFSCTVTGDTVFGSYTGSDYQDSIRLFAPSFGLPSGSYLGPLTIKAVA
ncbi:hypothetical protein TWF694_011465 [Orbilia ellipsospora]|uniref:Uncharacterized protein n=1 Tax=Orbilia ellipsospora TaxID=2528407 RepID=A0AAV9XBI9_9PEZI